ncbi:beta-ketoacyl synthase N-terminal-like domain-containing protein [Kitasatospora sp. NPDC058162]|uniref:beta-ketoacyl synthase N-terminal-like domain-containing protein n=1 Tax=Kitasatospora sp. NPDC058162 TaxID=3346362 RepID=UPI0036D8FE1B
MRDNDVAVIGLSFRLPQATDWDSLIDLLEHGRDTVRPMPPARARVTRLRTGPDDRHGGWLDDIADFDYRYFGISRAEAEQIDPRQRLTLQLAVDAVGNAGYSPESLRGARAAVLVAAHGGPHPGLYDQLAPSDQCNGTAFTGSLHAFAAGRVAYHLDLRGPTFTVDTACSSFLVALHEARAKVARGEVDLALVGGCQLVLGQPSRRVDNPVGLGVESATDRCRPFDIAADGAGFGEGGGFVVLKRLSDAVADGDNIHAVLHGSAINSDGGRSNGITSPSPSAQAEVIVAAWQAAGISGADVDYVEAHGTGTRIGDPIEIQGLTEAFGTASRTSAAVVSSVKGTFGHLSGMAGFAGLMRVIAQFRVGKVFPTPHFTAPNPLLGLDGELVEIAGGDRCSDDRPLLAGISGFGLSGTNAHVVVGAPPTGPEADEVARPRLIVLSARDEAGLTAHLHRTRAAIAGTTGLNSIADVLMYGREQFRYRFSCVADDVADLCDRLDRAVAGAPGSVPGAPPAVVLALGDVRDVGHDAIRQHCRDLPGFARVRDEAAGHIPPQQWTAAQRYVVWTAGLCTVLADLGIAARLVLSHGAGTAAARWLRGEQALATSLDEADALTGAPAPDPARLAAALSGTQERLVIDLAGAGALSELLRATGAAPVTGTCLELARTLFQTGHQLNWTAGFGRPASRRRELPVAPPVSETCWPATVVPTAHQADVEAEPEAVVTAAAPRSVAEVVLVIAGEVLKEPGLSLQDDFFDLGGNSLNGSQLINRVNQHFGTELDVLDLLDSPDLEAFAHLVEQESPAVAKPAAVSSRGAGPLSGQQAAIWAAIELEEESAAYNVPAAFLLAEAPDPGWLADRLTALVNRHPMLRTSLEVSGDGVRQVVHPAAPVTVTELDLDLSAHDRATGREPLLAALGRLNGRPLSPYGAAHARFELVRAQFRDGPQHVLLLTFHHLFFDGWSWRIVLDALGDARLPGPDREYLGYVASQQGMLDSPRGEELVGFWSDYLRSAPDLALPWDHGSDAPGLVHDDGHLPLSLPADIVDALREIAREARVTMQMLLLTAWSALLWRIGAARDLCVSMPVAGRLHEDEGTVGCYVNTVLVRVAVKPGDSFRDLLGRVKESSLRALAHADLPADRVLRLTVPAGGKPIVTTMFDYQSGFVPMRRLGTQGPAVELLDTVPVGAKYPLNLTCIEYGHELRARLEFSGAQLRPETAARWLDDYREALVRVTDLGIHADLFEIVGAQRDSHSPIPLPDFQF